MKKEDLENYIELLINDTEADEEKGKINLAILFLVVYLAGLKKQDFPLYKVLSNNLDIEHEIDAPFHALVGQLAVLLGNRPLIGKDFIFKIAEETLKRLKI